MKKVTLNLSVFEFGQIMGAVSDKRDNLTERLRLKLDIQFTKAYLDHLGLGRLARKNIAEYEIRLKELKNKHI